MKLKSQINLTPTLLLGDITLKEEFINNFFDRALMSKPLEFYLLSRNSGNKFDSITLSIRVLIVKGDKNEYLKILKYHLYNLDGLITKNNSSEVTEKRISVNTHLKRVKDIFNTKLADRNISIKSIIGVFIEFKFD